MPPGWEPTSTGRVDSLFSLRVGPSPARKGRRNYHLLYSGSARIARTLDLDQVFETLENYLLLTVAYWAKEDHLFVHAGVVGWNGQAVVIPGRSYSGKSTLVSELIRAGATYYSDEMAVFDPFGRVHPYPIPLSMREEEGTSRYTPEYYGSQAGDDPLPVAVVLSTHYEEAASWRPRVLTPARTLMALLDNTVAARKDPAISLPILRQVVGQAKGIKTRRGEASQVAQKILDLVADA